MNSFTLDTCGFKYVRRRLFSFIAAIILIIVCIAGAFDIWYPKTTSFSMFGFSLPAILLLLGVMIGQLKNYRRLWESYTLFLSNNEITRKQFGVRDTTISRNEVKYIYESPITGLKVISENFEIGIPRFINGYNIIKENLIEWKHFEQNTYSIVNLLTTYKHST